ncbi:glycosyltransferase family 4 protein [Myroides odoratimimus]|uniref:glycosyltransferase family 4 protein n=1 Tax=Myroides odoratimimus TaxID=76832 RepID=UPI003F4306E9
MRILLWAPYGAGTHYWGPGTSAFRLYKDINAKHNVKVTLIHASKLQKEFPDTYVSQIKVGDLENVGAFGKILYLVKSLLWILKNYRDFDIVHGISGYIFTFIPLVFFEILGIPTVIKITGENGGFQNNSLISRVIGFSFLRKKSSHLISSYISISTEITNILLRNKIKKEKIRFIPNGVDTSRFYPIERKSVQISRKKLSVDDKFTICYVGGLTENKRVFEVVSAVINLRNRKGFDIQFLIVGPDRSNGAIEDKISELIKSESNENKNAIKRILHTTSPEIFLQISDVFILNSRAEGLANSLLEAMSTGLFCLVTKVSGSSDLILSDKSGFFMDGSILHVEHSIERVYKLWNDNKELGKVNRKIILDNYDSILIGDKHIKLFQDVITSKTNS